MHGWRWVACQPVLTGLAAYVVSDVLDCAAVCRGFFAKHGFLHHRRPRHWHSDECKECDPMKALVWTAIANGLVAGPTVAMVL